jgi:hypothetical protein
MFARVASVIQADVDGLRVMAGRFGAVAGQVALGVAPAGVGLVCQATSAAVSAVHTGAGAAAAALAARVQATSVRVLTGASAHAVREADSAAALGALAPPMTAV